MIATNLQEIKKVEKEKIPGIHFPIIKIGISKKRADNEYKKFLKRVKKSKQRWEVLLKIRF